MLKFFTRNGRFNTKEVKMSESINKTSQKDQTTDEKPNPWDDLASPNSNKEGSTALSGDEATVEDLAFLFNDVDDEDKVENYTQQE